VIFHYVFPGDPPEIDLTLGFYATGSRKSTSELRDATRTFLRQFDGRFLTVDTLEFVDAQSRAAPVARALSSPAALSLRWLARRAANRLDRLA